MSKSKFGISDIPQSEMPEALTSEMPKPEPSEIVRLSPNKLRAPQDEEVKRMRKQFRILAEKKAPLESVFYKKFGLILKSVKKCFDALRNAPEITFYFGNSEGVDVLRAPEGSTKEQESKHYSEAVEKLYFSALKMGSKLERAYSFNEKGIEMSSYAVEYSVKPKRGQPDAGPDAEPDAEA